MNAPRPEPITLRHFQYLALLRTEILLDRHFQRLGGLGLVVQPVEVACLVFQRQ